MRDINIKDAVESGSIRTLINSFSLLSFFVANAIIFYIFSVYYVTPSPLIPISWITVDAIVFFTGVIISALVVKTDMFLGKNRMPLKEKFVDKIKRIRNASKIFRGRYRYFIITRLLFFNILNELFITLITWTAIFSFLGLIGVMQVMEGKMSIFMDIVTLIGIISGIFQFYISYYKKQVSKRIETGLSGYVISIYRKISFDEFLVFMKNKDKQLYDTLQEKIKLEVFNLMFLSGDIKSESDISLKDLVSGFPTDIGSKIVEFSGIPNERIERLYEEFFTIKDSEIKKEIDGIDADDIRKITLPNVMLFDEISDFITQFHYMSMKRESDSFEGHQARALRDNLYYLVEKILS